MFERTDKPKVSLAGEYALRSKAITNVVASCADTSMPPDGWLMSIKYDGWRAVWDPEQRKMITRDGIVIQVPQLWLERLPTTTPLDGELVVGVGASRKGLDSGLVLNASDKITDAERTQAWKAADVRYMAFDVYDPDQRHGTYSKERLPKLQRAIEHARNLSSHAPTWVVPVLQIPCKNTASLEALFARFIKSGCEGLILRAPHALYQTGRTATLIKRKGQDVAEDVRVIGVNWGEARTVKSLKCVWLRMENHADHPFSVAGLPRDIAQSDPDVTVPPGTLINIRFRGVTNHGLPQHPSFEGIRRKGRAGGKHPSE